MMAGSCAALRTRMEIRIGVSEQMAPYQFLDNQGQLAGIHYDLLKSLEIGSDDSVSVLYFDSEDACLEALEDGEVDAVLSYRLPAELSYAQWATEPLTTLKLCAISKTGSLEDAEKEGQVAAFEYGTVNYSYLQHLDATSYLAVGSQRQILQALEDGRADVAIGFEDALLYQLEQSGESDEFTVLRSYLGEVSYRLVVHPGNRVMLRRLNDQTVNLRSGGTYDRIYNQWSSLWVQDTSYQQRVMMRKLWIALGAAMAAVLLFLAFSAILKRRLAALTKVLNRTNEELQLQLSATQQECLTQQRILDAAKLSMLLFDDKGQITMYNREALMLANQQLEGKNIMDVSPYAELLEGIFPPTETEDAPTVMNATKRLGETLFKYSARVITSSKTYMLSVEDITEEEAQKAKLFEAEKSTTINRVVAGVAHEIRNPLMTIRTFAERSKEPDCGDDVQAAFGEVVPAEVDRINQLVDRFINYAKPGKPGSIVTDASNLVRECLYLTKPAAKKNVIGFDVQLEDALFIRVSPTQIKQVIINIIINGMEAMERRVALTQPDRKLMMQIRTVSEDDRAVICIRDEGTGMSPEDLKKCREPYYTTKPTGIGLGLALSNELVLQNGGQMELESVLGDHTTIRLVFSKEHNA